MLNIQGISIIKTEGFYSIEFINNLRYAPSKFPQTELIGLKEALKLIFKARHLDLTIYFLNKNIFKVFFIKWPDIGLS